MIEIPKMQGVGPMVGTAAGFMVEDFQIIITAPNRQLLERFCELSGVELSDNVYEIMLAPMEHVEVVGAPGMATMEPGKGRC